MSHRFKYKWYLKDGYPKGNGLNVFGTFICGGGSTMGYKLAGFNHLGGVEIDPKVADVYKANHNPKHLYVEDIRTFNNRTDLPEELYNLDILDGSPPCSTFSMAGSREKAWGKEKVFREGQAMQTLDDLVFVYCDTIIKLRPKVFILENVKGIIQGNAKVYSKNIVKKMTAAGYTVQVFCLNAASMGVPQKRERVFFIGHRKELKYPKLRMEFNEKAVTFGEFDEGLDKPREQITQSYMDYWVTASNGRATTDKGNTFGYLYKTGKSETCATILANSSTNYCHYQEPLRLTNSELCTIGTYPIDYNFKDIDPQYLIGMSVPPVMTAQIATEIYLQWFKNN